MNEPQGQVYSLEEDEIAELSLQSSIQKLAQQTYDSAQQALNAIVSKLAAGRLGITENQEFRYELNLEEKRITVFPQATLPKPQDHKPKQPRKK